MRSARATFTLGFGLAFSWPLATPAQTVTFDIGAPESAVARCAEDGASFEYFPPYAFGTYYPAGSRLEVTLARTRCSDWPNVPGTCFGVYIVTLRPAYDCGCNLSGVLELPTDLELHYDPAAVRAAGVREQDLRLVNFGQLGPVWSDVPGATVDGSAHALRAHATGFVLGLRWYAIAGEPSGPTGVTPAAWSAAKQLWR